MTKEEFINSPFIISRVLLAQKLIRIQNYLRAQVTGDYADAPIIPGGFYGKNFRNALGIIDLWFTQVESQINLFCIQNAQFRIGYDKYMMNYTLEKLFQHLQVM